MYFSPTSRRYRLIQAIKHTQGLVGYWPLSETAGSTAKNYALVNRITLDGTTAGGTIVNQAGKVGRAYKFDGAIGTAANGTVTIANSSPIDITGALTILAIINPASSGEAGSAGRIADKENGSNGYIWLIQTTSGNTMVLSIAGVSKTSSSSAWNTNSYQFVAVTYNGSNINFYNNGLNVGTVTNTANPTTNTGNFIIGNNSATTRTFDGPMQHIAVFNRGLSAFEVKKLTHIAGFI